MKSAVMVTDTTAPTALVVMGKSTVIAPPGTVTVAGTAAEPLLLESVTMAPPTGAALVRVTVPIEEDPPVTLVGFTEMLESAGGLTVSPAVFVAL